MTELEHIPVLLEESVENLLYGRKTGIYVDATLGGGGTSKKILSELDCDGKVIGIDRDPKALEISTLQLKTYPNFTAVRANFRALDRILRDAEIEAIDGIIFDLGVSSIQLEDPSRGFSFCLNSRLDMRMDLDGNKISAYDLLKSLSETSLAKLFVEFGEDRWAGRIASKIAERRRTRQIETTAELAQLIVEAIPKKFHPRRVHPATRFFQALRIAVNQELECLEEGLEKAVKALKCGGRIVVISYHSLEDRITKHKFREMSKERKILKPITKKPITPGIDEINVNPRSRSAKMRVAEKIL